MRYKIEKNTVQETPIIPLYARKMCSELYWVRIGWADRKGRCP